jgi:hypothetical protein
MLAFNVMHCITFLNILIVKPLLYACAML